MDTAKSLIFVLLLVFIIHFVKSNAQSSSPPILQQPGLRFVVAGVLSFIAAVISSAGGIGGGGLFVPILIIVAGLDVNTATSYSAFMVTGGSMANVATHVLQTEGRIDYDIALLSEPAMLLGVSVGVILNVVLPEWLITAFFVVFIAFCTFKTCKSGVCFWQQESEEMRRMTTTTRAESTKVPLLSEGLEEGKMGIPWMKVVVLVAIWISFFLLNLLRRNTNGHGIIHIKICSKAYWIISLLQIPLAIICTTWIIFALKTRVSTHQDLTIQRQPSRDLIFPVVALLAGLLGGVFGIGGGMLISPFLLQLGIGPEVTAATCSFMVFFSSTMSAIQYVLVGMEEIGVAVGLAVVCFVASLIGLTLVEQVIVRYGRASLIVFSIGTVMGFSTLLMTSFGAMETWRDYSTGRSMGFHKPC